MPPTNQSPLLGMLMPIILIYVIFYFVLIRPQRKEQKQRKDMISNLKKNDEVVTTGGVHGTIVNVKEKTYVLRVDDNAKIEIDKGSVGYLKKKAAE